MAPPQQSPSHHHGTGLGRGPQGEMHVPGLGESNGSTAKMMARRKQMQRMIKSWELFLSLDFCNGGFWELRSAMKGADAGPGGRSPAAVT